MASTSRPPSSMLEEYATAPNSPGEEGPMTPPQPLFNRDTHFGESPAPSEPSSQLLPSQAPQTPLTDGGDGQLLAGGSEGGKEMYDDHAPVIPGHNVPRYSSRKRRRRWLVLTFVGLVILAIVVLAVVLPIFFTVIRPRHRTSAASTGGQTGGSGGSSGGDGGGGGGGGGGSTPSSRVSGGNGTVITMEDGTQFTYINNFGGTWYSDPTDPYNNNAQAQSYTPPLNASWNFGVDRIWGVNIGGLFVPEPFIAPALFQKYPGAVDEWTLSEAMAADKGNGGLNQMEDHYNTFYTEKDFAEIAAAGLNWVRIPIPYWAIEKYQDEPFLERISWKYILRVLQWCRKYGLRVKMDLHTIPGSQNGYNHSGRMGQINFLSGPMGLANAERALYYIRVLTEFFSQPEWTDLIQIFGIVNEPRGMVIGQDVISSFNIQAHDMIRDITGRGSGKGAWISVHDGFLGLSSWSGTFQGADRMIIDDHPYFAFDGQPNDDPVDTWALKACQAWGKSVNSSLINFGMTINGEYSNGFNDCGLFLNGVPGSNRFPGDCSQWTVWENWDQDTKDGLRQYTLASMDALRNSFFWTWKIGNSTADNSVRAPLWSYQLGLEQGWMPTDPRGESAGKCAKLGVSGTSFPGTFAQPYMTGGSGAGTIVASSTNSFPWPPSTIVGADGPATALPTYAVTGSVVTLPPPSITATPTPTVSLGDGWADDADNAPGVTPVAGCTYPDAWSASGLPVPPPCTAAAAKRTAVPRRH